MKLSFTALFALASMATIAMGAPVVEPNNSPTCPGCDKKGSLTSRGSLIERETADVPDLSIRDKGTCPGCDRREIISKDSLVERETTDVPVLSIRDQGTCPGCD
ncbi:hypothetical protein AB5N19_07779 [Seiridium cardinale]|uniref:Uncharacterized protein n=1 Tax=Seiridium cardinale TaxID=138064 RepID=A0ABR2Y1Z2_9PEZI